MRIVFAGTPEFAVPALQALTRDNHEIVAVLTQPDRRSGRGRKLHESPVKLLARREQLPVLQPESLRKLAPVNALRDLAPDLMVVAAYGLILPQRVLDIPRLGCWNIHASLLPRWRGAAPVQRAIMAGDEETGVALMQMEAGLDTGPVLLQRKTRIADDDTGGTLTARLANMGADILIDGLMRRDKLTATAQFDALATYAQKITREDTDLSWNDAAIDIVRAVRALNPQPGVRLPFQDETIKLWKAEPSAARGEPGEVIRADSNGILVATNDGAVNMLELQRPGGRRISAADYLNARPL